jgi:hypothetical protein
MLALSSARKHDLPLYLPTKSTCVSSTLRGRRSRLSVEEFVDVRPVVAIAIDGVGTEVVLQDMVGHVDGIIKHSNLCSTNERRSIESISNLVCNSRVINHLGLQLLGRV